MMPSMRLKIIQLYIVFLCVLLLTVIASRWGLPFQGAGQPRGGQKSPFPPPAGGLGRLQLRFSEDYLISVSKTHTLVSIHLWVLLPENQGKYKEGYVSFPCTFQEEGRKRENMWEKWGKGREGIKYFLTSGDACRDVV